VPALKDALPEEPDLAGGEESVDLPKGDVQDRTSTPWKAPSRKGFRSAWQKIPFAGYESPERIFTAQDKRLTEYQEESSSRTLSDEWGL
jgi:hypothetical protein